MMGYWINVWTLITTLWLPFVVCAAGTILGHVGFYLGLGAFERRKKIRMIERAAQREAIIVELKAALWDSYQRGKAAEAELAELRPMVAEKRNHDRAWAMRVKAVMNKHVSTN